MRLAVIVALIATVRASADGVPSYVEGRLARLEGTSDTHIRRALEKIAPMFALEPEQLETTRVSRDANGMTHIRLRQRANGLPVVGGDLVLHADAEGTVFAVNGTARGDGLPPPEPRIDAAAARAVAAAHRAGEVSPPRLLYVITPGERTVRLAWEVEVRGLDAEGPFRDLLYVDARDGAIALVQPQILSALRRAVYTAAGLSRLPGALLRSEGSGPVADAVVNRNYDYLGLAYDCFAQLFGRDSYDNKGATLVSSVHYGYQANQAWWTGDQMWFGGGDGVLFANLALSYDVTVHELMHGVTQVASALGTSNEPGALNEAMSDIMGAVCEQRAPGTGSNGWSIAETVYTPGRSGDALRYLDDPTRDGISRDYYPERYIGTGDFGGVHLNSGIANLAFYLLANGGRHPRGKTAVDVSGIGLTNAARIFMHANEHYFTWGTTFVDARNHTIRAAMDLFGSGTADRVAQAWEAVGVPAFLYRPEPGDPPLPPPTPPPPPAAPANLFAAPGMPGQIVLTWQDNSTNENGFSIERRSGPLSYAEVQRVNANVTSFTNTNLIPGTYYLYRVRAYNSGGSSAYSNEAAAIAPSGNQPGGGQPPANTAPPAAPSALKVATATPTMVQLRWADNSANEAGFVIERGRNTSSFAEVARPPANAVTHEDRGIVENTTYLYRVRAYNTAGASAYTSIAEVRTPTAGGPPSGPADLSARADSLSSVTLSWRDTSTDETAFVVERAREYAGFLTAATLPANTTSYADNSVGLAKSPRAYPIWPSVTYRVRACRSGLCSDYSNEVTLSTICTGALSSEASSFGGAGGSGQYTVSALRGCSWFTQVLPLEAAKNWITLTGDSGDGTGTVRFDLKPLDAGRRTIWLNTSTVWVSPQTGERHITSSLQHTIEQVAVSVTPPSKLAVTSLTDTTALLEWSGGEGAASFTIERRSACQAAFETLGTSDTNGYIDTAREAGLEYAYRVNASGHGLTSDYSNVAPQLGVSSSCSGGTESVPLFLWTGGALPVLDSVRGAHYRPPPMWQWANRLGAVRADAQTDTLTPLFPAAPAGTIARPTVPRDVLGFSNAVESVGVDYVFRTSGRTAASIAAFRSIGTPYAHDYAVCGRFKEGTLEAVEPVAIVVPGRAEPAWFWRARMSYEGREPEWAVTFAAFAYTGGHVIESKWISDAYPETPSGNVLTFQVWSSDAAQTERLVRALLEKLAARGALRYDNALAPVAPLLFARSGSYDGTNVVVSVENRTTEPALLRFVTVYWTGAEQGAERRHVFEAEVPSGSTAVRIPVMDLLNGVVYVDDGRDFSDKLFVADGHWFGFDSGPNARVTFDGTGCVPSPALTALDRIVSGCGTLRGALDAGAFAGFGRGLDPPSRRSVDVRRWQAVTFFARGDGKSYRMNLETVGAARIHAPPHRIRFTAPEGGKQFIVPLRAFRQPHGTPADKQLALEADDVRVLSWSAASAPLASVGLSVEQVGFTNSLIIGGTTVLPHTASSGPFRVTTTINDDIGLESASLVYRVDDGPFVRIPLAAGDGGIAYTATIPAAPLGARVSYYIEAFDGSGNVATDPFDAPAETYAFEVSLAPAIVIDDFRDVDPENARGGEPFVFAHSGAAASASYEEGRLRLTWNVTARDSFAGWLTAFAPLDLRGVDALRFRIRGASGGEHLRIGVKWSPAAETKLLLSQHGRVRTTWSEVTIPLAAFARVGDWSRVEGVVLVFENAIGSGSGVVEIDDLRFVRAGLRPLPLDNFEAASGENAFGGATSVSSGGGAHANGAYERGDYAFTFRGVGADSWAALSFDIGGVDVSRQGSLAVSISGSAGARANVYLVSGSGAGERRAYVDLERYGTVTSAWTTISIPLAAWPIDLRDVRTVVLAMEWEAMEGTIRLDEIRFGPATSKQRSVR